MMRRSASQQGVGAFRPLSSPLENPYDPLPLWLWLLQNYPSAVQGSAKAGRGPHPLTPFAIPSKLREKIVIKLHMNPSNNTSLYTLKLVGLNACSFF